MLIVDDSENHRSKLRQLLEELGGEVTEAVSGAEALSLYSKCRPDVVALDRVLPDLDGVSGLSTLEQLRRVDPDVKVVMLASSHTVSEMLQAREAGAAGFLLKPLKREKVRDVLHRLLHLER